MILLHVWTVELGWRVVSNRKRNDVDDSAQSERGDVDSAGVDVVAAAEFVYQRLSRSTASIS